MKKPAPFPFLPGLPELPSLGQLSLPDLPDLPDLDAMLAEPPPNPLDDPRVTGKHNGNIEHDTAVDNDEIFDQFAAIREGRKQQEEARLLANDTEFWFAAYFQSREQKEAFLKAMDWFQHGDKYLDGRYLARTQGIELPARPAPYKVGKLDAKFVGLTK